MLFIFLIFICLFLFHFRFDKNSGNNDYLSKSTTTIVNGLFVILVFFSHFNTYANYTFKLDIYFSHLLGVVGQLMVTSFLFYSGYGIYESIKRKKGYLKTFFKNRIIPTFINFAIAVVLFLIVDFFLDKKYDLYTIILSLFGYESIGNSNWYMLATFYLYFCILICFNNYFRKYNIEIILLIILSIIYVLVLYKLKNASYYVDTILCFPFGIIYSKYKDKIENFIIKNYFITLFLSFLLFVLLYVIYKYIPNIFIYNIYSICFILIIVIVSMRFSISSTFYSYIGKHVFWIYILQRIPMMIFSSIINNVYFLFALCFLITLLLSYFFKKVTDFFWHFLLKKSN